jgi:hypothetical protein
MEEEDQELEMPLERSNRLLCLPDLAELAEAIKPSPARDLVLMWLHLKRLGQIPRASALSLAERQCRDDEELGGVYYIEAMILFYAGEISAAIDKATKCLHLSTRIGYKLLEAQTLLYLGRIYETLGHKELGAEYADAASKTMSGQTLVRLP